MWGEFKNIKLSVYLNNLQFKTKDIFTNTNFKYNLGLINNYDLAQTNTKLIKLGYFSKKLTKQNSFNLFLNKNFIKNNFFEIDKLDETFISEDNFRIKNVKLPIKIHLGILNKNNLQILFNSKNKLSKNLLISYKVGRVDTTQKLSHFEEF